MINPVSYYRTAELPSIRLWLRDDNKNLVDLTSASFVFKVGNPGSAAIFTKSSGITGAAGSGVEPTGTPNVTIAFSAGEWDSVAVGPAAWQIKATIAGQDRFWQGPFHLYDVIT